MNVQTFDLSNNLMENLPELLIESSFEKISSTKLISFANNRLNNISSLSISGKIEKIDLSDNLLIEIPDNFFHGIKIIDEFDISNNPIGLIPEVVKKIVSKLKVLKLNKCSIKELADWTTPEIYSTLENLELRGNTLENIKSSQFIAIRNSLTTLNLRDNLISTLSEDSFKSFKNLEKLFLVGNPWICNCALNWIRSYNVDKAKCRYKSANINDYDINACHITPATTITSEQTTPQLTSTTIIPPSTKEPPTACPVLHEKCRCALEFNDAVIICSELGRLDKVSFVFLNKIE